MDINIINATAIPITKNTILVLSSDNGYTIKQADLQRLRKQLAEHFGFNVPVICGVTAQAVEIEDRLKGIVQC